MKAVQLLSLLLLLAACSTPPSSNSASTDGGDTGEGGFKDTRNIPHNEKTAQQFIRRFEGLRVGLLNYFDPTEVELVNRQFTCETVVFRLNSTGDTGALHGAAADLAAELAIKLGWEHSQTATSESMVESHLAVVSIRSIGIPAGAKPGDTIPVAIELKGNATDIHGGYVYTTPLKNSAGRTVAILKEGYLPFDVNRMEPEDVTEDMRQDAKNLERREAAKGSWFLLRKGVTIQKTVLSDDLSADQIILPLVRKVNAEEVVRTLSSDLIPDVVADIKRQMAEIGLPAKVDDEPGKIIITPLGVREISLQQVYERVEELRVELKPKNRIIIVFDDTLFRVAIYGPVAHRFLIDGLALTTDPFTRDKPNVDAYQLPFRVSCRLLQRADPGRSRLFGVADADNPNPDGHRGRVRLAWSRWKDGKQVEEQTEELPTSDISEILRHLWVRGMGPREVLAFVVEAEASYAINAELGFNHHKIDLDRISEANPGD